MRAVGHWRHERQDWQRHCKINIYNIYQMVRFTCTNDMYQH